MVTIIVHGTQGGGKTVNAKALAAHFGCRVIVDNWRGVETLGPGSLALTNLDPSQFTVPDGTVLVEYNQAVSAL